MIFQSAIRRWRDPILITNHETSSPCSPPFPTFCLLICGLMLKNSSFIYDWSMMALVQEALVDARLLTGWNWSRPSDTEKRNLFRNQWSLITGVFPFITIANVVVGSKMSAKCSLAGHKYIAMRAYLTADRTGGVVDIGWWWSQSIVCLCSTWSSWTTTTLSRWPTNDRTSDTPHWLLGWSPWGCHIEMSNEQTERKDKHRDWESCNFCRCLTFSGRVPFRTLS